MVLTIENHQGISVGNTLINDRIVLAEIGGFTDEQFQPCRCGRGEGIAQIPSINKEGFAVAAVHALHGEAVLADDVAAAAVAAPWIIRAVGSHVQACYGNVFVGGG